MPFVEHTYLYHFTRIDHRHNFSVYNTALHLNSAQGGDRKGFAVERIAFIPQLFLCVLAMPLMLAKRDLASTMLAQTFAFVTFNKVCTSQVCPQFFPPGLRIHILRFSSISCGTWCFCHSISRDLRL